MRFLYLAKSHQNCVVFPPSRRGLINPGCWLMCLTNHCTLTSGIITVHKRHSGFLFCWENTYPDLGDRSPSNQRSSSVIFTFLPLGVFWIKFFVLFSVQGNMLDIFCCCSHTHWTLIRFKMASVFLTCKLEKKKKKYSCSDFRLKIKCFSQ